MILSYGHAMWGAGTHYIIPSTELAYDLATTGADKPVYGYEAVHRTNYGVIETGELHLESQGQKGTLTEVWIRTYTNFTTQPDIIVGMMGPGETSWSYVGSTDGTIAQTSGVLVMTGTAFSNKLGTGTGAVSVYTTPCAATAARIYLDSTLQVLGTDYTITGTNEITFVSPVGNGVVVWAYWDNRPFITATAGDYLEGTDGYHRITTINTATSVTLDWLAAGDESMSHRASKALVAGEAETIFGVYRSATTVRLRIVVLPRYAADAATDVKVLGVTLVMTPSGERQLRG